MRDALTHAMRSRSGRAVGAVLGAVLAAFLAGYALFGPIAMHLMPR